MARLTNDQQTIMKLMAIFFFVSFVGWQAVPGKGKREERKKDGRGSSGYLFQMGLQK